MRRYFINLPIVMLLASCSQQLSSINCPDSLAGQVVDFYFEQGDVDIRVIGDVTASWEEHLWRNDSLTIPSDLDQLTSDHQLPRPLTSVSYKKISNEEAYLTYSSASSTGSSPVNYSLKLHFTTDTSGVAEGSASDYEWSMRCDDVPFSIRMK